MQQEIEAREAETGRLFQLHVERTRYESDLAERRYKRVDPDNRLVARREEEITAHIRFKGGANQTIHVPVYRRSTDPKAVAMVQDLLRDHHDTAAIVKPLNQRGIKTARGKEFNTQAVCQIILRYHQSSSNEESSTVTAARNPCVIGARLCPLFVAFAANGAMRVDS